MVRSGVASSTSEISFPSITGIEGRSVQNQSLLPTNSSPSRALGYLRQQSSAVHPKPKDGNPVSYAQGFNAWQGSLRHITGDALQLMVEDATELNDLNEIGVYHRFSGEFYTTGTMPLTWITHRIAPGLWCALFAAHNASGLIGDPFMVRVEFNKNWYLYSPLWEEHQNWWESWRQRPENTAKPNSWSGKCDLMGRRMDEAVTKVYGCPNHSAFFQEHRFGAVIFYTFDYVRLVIIDREAVFSILEA